VPFNFLPLSIVSVSITSTCKHRKSSTLGIVQPERSTRDVAERKRCGLQGKAEADDMNVYIRARKEREKEEGGGGRGGGGNKRTERKDAETQKPKRARSFAEKRRYYHNNGPSYHLLPRFSDAPRHCGIFSLDPYEISLSLSLSLSSFLPHSLSLSS